MTFQVWKTSESNYVIFNSEKLSPLCYLSEHLVASFTESELKGLREAIDHFLTDNQNAIRVPEVEEVDINNLKLDDDLQSVLFELELMEILTEVEAKELKRIFDSFAGEVKTLNDLFNALMYYRGTDGRKGSCPNTSTLAAFLTRRQKISEKLLNFFCPVVVKYLSEHEAENPNEVFADGKYVKQIPPFEHIWKDGENIVLETCGDIVKNGFDFNSSKEQWSIRLYGFNNGGRFVPHSSNLRLMVRLLYLVVFENSYPGGRLLDEPIS
ncbi:hypothetical protein IJG10_00155 [Candidatus Saccharibacteria bacterium]|nr:hypothetical protein [Candidatus Saccharibacteria bacterium]